jgi:hypothetical protein
MIQLVDSSAQLEQSLFPRQSDWARGCVGEGAQVELQRELVYAPTSRALAPLLGDASRRAARVGEEVAPMVWQGADLVEREVGGRGLHSYTSRLELSTFRE